MPLLASILRMRNRRKPASPKGAATVSEHGPVSAKKNFMLTHRASRLLVLTCLTLSIVGFNYASKYMHLKAQYEFQKLSAQGAQSIRSRMATFEHVLMGTAAHMGALETVNAEGFGQYVAGLDLAQNFPGIPVVGFVQPIQKGAITALEQSLSKAYERDVHVRPVTPHAEKLVVTHIAPLRGNEWVIGLDEGFEAGRKAALEFARARRRTALTSRVELVKDASKRTSFILARAVFAINPVGRADTTAGDRFLGWVLAPIIGESVFTGLTEQLENDYRLTIYEGAQTKPDTPLLASDGHNGSTGAMEQSYVIDLYGQRWTLKFESTVAFDAIHTSHLPKLLLFTGLLLSFLLWLAMRSAALRNRVLAIVAEQRRRQLDASFDENRTLLENSALAVMTLDSDRLITFANATAGAMFNHVPKALVGRSFDQFVTFVSTTGTGQIANASGVDAENVPLMLDVQANAWRTADGKEQTTVLIRDVTDQINSRQAIEEVHKRYDVALTGAGIGIFEVDLTDGSSVVSDTWHQIMGTHTFKEAFDHQKHFLSRIHPDDLANLLESDQQCISGKTQRSEAEYRVQFPEGWRWMYSDAVPVARGKDGWATRLIGTQTDVTELRHARNAMEVSEARFRMMLEVAPVGTATLDDKGAFITVNAALANLSGYDQNRLGAQMRLADLLSRKDFVQMSRDIRDLLSEKKPKTYQNQFQVHTRSGELRWGLFNFSWTYDRNNGENVYIVQIVDINDQKLVEKMKGEFVATVSHELRTPLTSIKGALGLLEASAAATMSDTAKRLLRIGIVNSDRLTVMVNDILDLERLSSGKVAFECEDALLHDVVIRTMTAMEPFAKEHENTLVMASVDKRVEVHADIGRLQQVLTNLVSNACKFSEPQTDVTIRYDVRQGDVMICVENIGPIIPESFQSQMFNAFTQADGSDTRSKGGTGLGLNISRQIMKRLGGRIGFHQGQDRRTVFWITCPLAIAEERYNPAPKVDKALREAMLPKILHVEDDLDFADVIQAGFEGLAQITNVTSIARARQSIKNGTIDVVLLDWSLPDGHALILLDDIYAHHPGAAVIGLSATNEAPSDPRVGLSLTKSRVDIHMIVQHVLEATQAPSEITKKAAI